MIFTFSLGKLWSEPTPKNQLKDIIILLRKQSKFKAEENMLKSSEIPSSIINSEQLPKSPLDFKAH